MKLNSRVQYALIIVLELKKAQAIGAITLKDMSIKHNMSLHFLEQVARDLRIADIIASKKGPGGGYYLSNTDPVRVSEVIKAVHKTELKLAVDSESGRALLEKIQLQIDLGIEGIFC